MNVAAVASGRGGRLARASLSHHHAPWVLAGILALLYVLWQPAAGDLPAQTYRTWLFEHEGPSLFDTAWYGGHHLPGYSLLFPPLASLLGVQLVGGLSAVASAWLFARIAEETLADDVWIGSLWFGVATASTLLAGRLTFALGIAFALGSVLLAVRRRPAWGIAAAMGTAVASPVAALFLAMVLSAWWLVQRDRRDLLLIAVVGAAPVMAINLFFPEGGGQPMQTGTFLRTLGTTVAIALLLPPERKVLRSVTWVYALAILASFVIVSPMGSNVTRLGTLFAGPVLACALLPHRRTLLLVLALPLVQWQWQAPVLDWHRAHDDPLVQAREYEPVLRFLGERRTAEGPFRVEVPFTQNHVEADLVAREHPLARGWQRQLDTKRNGLFYDEGELEPGEYRRWLDENAVRYVALPEGRLDQTAKAERRLLQHGDVPGLTKVLDEGRWTVWRVGGPTATRLADTAEVVELDHDRVVLEADRPGPVLLRVRYTPYWRVAQGDACVSRAPGKQEWTRLRIRGAGRIVLVTTFSPSRVRAAGERCNR